MDGEIYHHGILGQKWGVRRFQNKDGSLTTAGKQRLKTGDSSKKRKVSDMTDDELRGRITRLQNEKTYSELLAEQRERNTSWGKKFAVKTLKSLADKSASTAIDMLVTHISNKYKNKPTDVRKLLDKDVNSIDPKDLPEVAKWFENASKVTKGQKDMRDGSKKETVDVRDWLDKDVKSIDPSVFSEVAKWYENASKISKGQEFFATKDEKAKKEE